MTIKLEIKLESLADAVKFTAFGLILAAVAQQLSRPPAERTWHGQVLGIPYDFRAPTMERLRDAYWNPAEPRVFTDRVFGLGWAINIPALGRWWERQVGAWLTQARGRPRPFGEPRQPMG